jgi:Lrp/AsnC family leucine-responsive transcriptional regulator
VAIRARKRIELDDIDRHILAELSDDGRLSNVELADRVGLSPSPCLRRVRRLEEAGVIRGYRAVIDEAYTERGLTAWVLVRTRVHEHELTQRFESRIVRLDGVSEVHHLAGDWDYVLRVEVDDLEAYDHFTREVMTNVPGIGQIHSLIVLSTLLDEDRAIR